MNPEYNETNGHRVIYHPRNVFPRIKPTTKHGRGRGSGAAEQSRTERREVNCYLWISKTALLLIRSPANHSDTVLCVAWADEIKCRIIYRTENGEWRKLNKLMPQYGIS